MIYITWTTVNFRFIDWYIDQELALKNWCTRETVCELTSLSVNSPHCQWTHLIVTELTSLSVTSPHCQWTDLTVSELTSLLLNWPHYQWPHLTVSELTSLSALSRSSRRSMRTMQSAARNTTRPCPQSPNITENRNGNVMTVNAAVADNNNTPSTVMFIRSKTVYWLTVEKKLNWIEWQQAIHQYYSSVFDNLTGRVWQGFGLYTW